MKSRNLAGLALCGGLVLLAGCAPETESVSAPPATDAPPDAVPKNVIVMISDGCGYHQIEAANLYRHGDVGVQVYEHFPVMVGMTTWSETMRRAGGTYDPRQAWSDPHWIMDDDEPQATGPGVTDSAAAATAMATGRKTYNGAIGVDPSGRRLLTILERAEILGKATGVVTSVQFAHATPACFVAHTNSRNDYALIANQMIQESDCEVIIGCGHPEFTNTGETAAESERDYQYVGGEQTWRAIRERRAGGSRPWTLVEDKDAFKALATGPTPPRLLGIPRVLTTLQKDRAGESKVPYDVPFNDQVPTLVDLSLAALNTLDDDPDGLFLMIEGGAVDWAGHSNDAARLIEEEEDFNASVDAVCRWIQDHGGWDETLLIVTADHETGYLTGPGFKLEQPLTTPGKGRMPAMAFHSGAHTNQLVPFFAAGAGATRFREHLEPNRDPIRGEYLDNTSIAKVVFALWAGPATPGREPTSTRPAAR